MKGEGCGGVGHYWGVRCHRKAEITTSLSLLKSGRAVIIFKQWLREVVAGHLRVPPGSWEVPLCSGVNFRVVTLFIPLGIN